MLKCLAQRTQREKDIPVADTTTPITIVAITGNNDGKRIPKELKRVLISN